MNDCIFCKIVAGEIPAEKIYEDEHTLAFLDITPVNPGHTLVIPKAHSTNIFDISREALAQVMEAVRHIAPAIQEAANADGVNIHFNNGAAAGQKIFHTHAHIIPRFTHDDLRMWKGKESSATERARLAAAIQSAQNA